jgi:hypothetical protein
MKLQMKKKRSLFGSLIKNGKVRDGDRCDNIASYIREREKKMIYTKILNQKI